MNDNNQLMVVDSKMMETVEHIRAAITAKHKKVSRLTEDMSKGKGGVAVLMTLGALIIGILGYLNIK